MHIPLEFLCLVGLVGKGSKWLGGKGWLPPKESGMPFQSRGKAGYLGADGKPAKDEAGKDLTEAQKAEILKKEKQMRDKELGVKPDSPSPKLENGKVDKEGFSKSKLLDREGNVILSGVSKNGMIYDADEKILYSQALNKAFRSEGKMSNKQAKDLMNEISEQKITDSAKISDKVRYGHQRRIEPKDLTTMTGKPINKGVVENIGKASGGGFKKADVILPVMTQESGGFGANAKGMGMKVSGEYKGDFVASRSTEGGYVTVSHIPSGRGLGSVENMKQAKAYINELSAAKVETLPQSFSDALAGGAMSDSDRSAIESIARKYIRSSDGL